MPTASSLIDTALENIGVLRVGGVARPNDSAKGLKALQSVLDALQLEPSAVVGLQELTYTPTLGAQSFTIGPSGSVVATQPVRIEPVSFYRVNGVDAPLRVGTLDEYNAQADKAGTGAPSFVALKRGYDTATVYLYPASDGASQLRLWVQMEPVSSFASVALGTNLTLPAGLRRALEWLIAEEILTAYQVDPQMRADVLRNAANAKRLLKRSNTRIGKLALPYGVPGRSSYDIEVD
jgi:hypothetical protein